MSLLSIALGALAGCLILGLTLWAGLVAAGLFLLKRWPTPEPPDASKYFSRTSRRITQAEIFGSKVNGPIIGQEGDPRIS